jgi:prophage DNA circulation protein
MIMNKVFGSISRLIDTIQGTNVNLGNMINNMSKQGSAMTTQSEATFALAKGISDAFNGIKETIKSSQATIEARIETATIRTEKKIDQSLDKAFSDHREKTQTNVAEQLRVALQTTTQAISESHKEIMDQFSTVTDPLLKIETKWHTVVTLLEEIRADLKTIKELKPAPVPPTLPIEVKDEPKNETA